MRLLQLQLGGVLDGDHPLRRRNVAREDVEQRRFAGPGAARDDHVHLGLGQGFQHQGHAGRQTLEILDQVVHAQRCARKTPDGHHRAIQRHRRNDGIHPRPIGQARIDHGAGFIDAPADARHDLVDDAQQVLFIGEDHGGQFQPALALDIDLVVAIDQDVRHRGIGHQLLQRAEAQHLVLDVADQLLALLFVDRRGVLGQQALGHAGDLLLQALFGQRVDGRQVKALQQFGMDAAAQRQVSGRVPMERGQRHCGRGGVGHRHVGAVASFRHGLQPRLGGPCRRSGQKVSE